MQQFEESNIIFSFPSNWSVIKFDKHRFYTYLSGHGLKGVDFIALENKEHLLLLEVKNYKERFEKKELAHPSDEGAFAKDIIKKFEDSLQLIQIAYKYYQRKWWYRLLEKYFSKFIKREKLFWTFANGIIQEEKKISLYLFYEADQRIKKEDVLKFKNTLTKNLQSHFKEKQYLINVIHSQTENLPFGIKE